MRLLQWEMRQADAGLHIGLLFAADGLLAGSAGGGGGGGGSESVVPAHALNAKSGEHYHGEAIRDNRSTDGDNKCLFESSGCISAAWRRAVEAQSCLLLLLLLLLVVEVTSQPVQVMMVVVVMVMIVRGKAKQATATEADWMGGKHSQREREKKSARRKTG